MALIVTDHPFCFQTIFPIVDLDGVNDALNRGFESMKAAILKLNVPDVDQQSLDRAKLWTHPAHVLDTEDCARALVDGSWAMAFRRYRTFHRELLSLRPRPLRRRHQPRKSHVIL